MAILIRIANGDREKVTIHDDYVESTLALYPHLYARPDESDLVPEIAEVISSEPEIVIEEVLAEPEPVIEENIVEEVTVDEKQYDLTPEKLNLMARSQLRGLYREITGKNPFAGLNERQLIDKLLSFNSKV